jgi:hypothetical protein
MTRWSRVWLAVASVFTLINLAGAGMAAGGGEMRHALLHVALTLVGGYFMWRFMSKRGRQEPFSALPAEDRLEMLQQSVDAIAIEVERIGEAQRFHAKLQQERVEARPPRGSAHESST